MKVKAGNTRDGQKLIAMHKINYGVWQSINCDCKLYAIN